MNYHLNVSTSSLTIYNQPRYYNVTLSTTKIEMKGGLTAGAILLNNKTFTNHNFESQIVKLSRGDNRHFSSIVPTPNNFEYWSYLQVYY